MFKSNRTFFLISFRSSHTFLKKHRNILRSSHTKKICSGTAAKIFTVTAHTLCEDFHSLSIVMKTSLMVIKPKALHVPWPILLFHRPVQASYHRLCSGHRLVSMLIDRVHLALLILKQNLLPVYCFTIKKARLIIIKRKAFSNHTFFCTFAAPLLHFFLSIFLYAYIFALKATNFAIFFHQPHLSSGLSLFYFFRWVMACFHPLNIHPYQNFSQHLLQYPCKNLQYLSRKQSC